MTLKCNICYMCTLWNDQVRLTVQSFAPNIYSFPVKALKYTFWLF